MNKLKMIFVLALLYTTGFTQDFKFEYLGPTTPTIKKQALEKANYIGEIMPDLWNNIGLAYREKVELDLILNYFPDENYSKIVDIVGIEIDVNSNGQLLTASSKNEVLTDEQKSILKLADFGSRVGVRLKFKHKYGVTNAACQDIRIGYYSATVVPETEAAYPGGIKALNVYLNENIIAKVQDEVEITQYLPDFVNFKIDQKGKVTDIRIFNRNEVPEIDELIRRAFVSMPEWTPAISVNGETVMQEFNIPFLGMGC